MPKPVKKKKKFISKKNATTYHLVPGLYTEDDGQLENPEQIEARKEEQRNHGIFYNDSYNYMKHLRSLTEEATMVNTKPFYSETQSSYGGSVQFKEFFSTDETPEEKIDDDIMAALEDAPEVKFEASGENVKDLFLPDNFIDQAGGVLEMKEEEDEDIYYDSDQYLSEEDIERSDFHWGDHSGDDDEEDEEEEEDYLQRSSRSRGNVNDDIVEAQTALILENFEKGLGFNFGGQNDDTEMQKVDDYEGLKSIIIHDKMKAKQVHWSEVMDDHADRPAIDVSRYENEDGGKYDEYEWKEIPPSKPKYDCVSILSLNSNTRNLPKDLIPPRPENKNSRKTSTNEPEQPQGMSLRELEEEIRESRKADRVSTFRPKDETLGEKKLRKQALKDERKERRMEKKANKIVFTIEKHKLHKEIAAQSKSGRGNKIS